MDEIEFLEKLTTIRLKVNRLLSRSEELEQENKQLQHELENCRNTIEIQKKTIEDLEESNKFIKLAKNFPQTGSDKFDVKIKINELVREIDRCIDLLNE